MRGVIVAGLIAPGLFLLGSVAAAPAHAADAKATAACQARRVEIAKKAEGFNGETMTKRLIQADLDRAQRELIEGDADECMEALDHANKLLSEPS